MDSIALKYDYRHGGPYDRGSADAYYRRPYSPHYYVRDTYNSKKITDLTEDEIMEYQAGYSDQNCSGDFKD
jgi:hypothetical protein